MDKYKIRFSRGVGGIFKPTVYKSGKRVWVGESSKTRSEAQAAAQAKIDALVLAKA